MRLISGIFVFDTGLKTDFILGFPEKHTFPAVLSDVYLIGIGMDDAVQIHELCLSEDNLFMFNHMKMLCAFGSPYRDSMVYGLLCNDQIRV